MGWATVNNQVCLAHLIHDVQHAIDAGDDIFAPTFFGHHTIGGIISDTTHRPQSL